MTHFSSSGACWPHAHCFCFAACSDLCGIIRIRWPCSLVLLQTTNNNRDPHLRTSLASLGSCTILLLPNLKYFSWDWILHTIYSLSGCSWNIDKSDQIQQLITADHSTSSNTWGRKRVGWSLIEQMMGLSFEEGARRTPARRGSSISHGLSKVRGGWMGWRWVLGLRKRGGNQPWYPPSLHPMYGQYHKTIHPSINRWPFCEASSVELH